MHGNLSEKNGSGAKTVSQLSQNTATESALAHTCNDPDFWDKLDKRNEITCELIAQRLINDYVQKLYNCISIATKIFIPIIAALMIALGSISIYFIEKNNQQLSNLNNSVIKLNENVAGLVSTVGATERQVQDHQKTIDRLQERLYTR